MSSILSRFPNLLWIIIGCAAASGTAASVAAPNSEGPPPWSNAANVKAIAELLRGPTAVTDTGVRTLRSRLDGIAQLRSGLGAQEAPDAS